MSSLREKSLCKVDCFLRRMTRALLEPLLQNFERRVSYSASFPMFWWSAKSYAAWRWIQIAEQFLTIMKIVVSHETCNADGGNPWAMTVAMSSRLTPVRWLTNFPSRGSLLYSTASLQQTPTSLRVLGILWINQGGGRQDAASGMRVKLKVSVSVFPNFRELNCIFTYEYLTIQT